MYKTHLVLCHRPSSWDSVMVDDWSTREVRAFGTRPIGMIQIRSGRNRNFRQRTSAHRIPDESVVYSPVLCRASYNVADYYYLKQFRIAIPDNTCGVNIAKYTTGHWRLASSDGVLPQGRAVVRQHDSSDILGPAFEIWKFVRLRRI